MEVTGVTESVKQMRCELAQAMIPGMVLLRASVQGPGLPSPPAHARAEDVGEHDIVEGILCARCSFWVRTGLQELSSPAAKHRLALRLVSAGLAVSSMSPTHTMKSGPPGSNKLSGKCNPAFNPLLGSDIGVTLLPSQALVFILTAEIANLPIYL